MSMSFIKLRRALAAGFVALLAAAHPLGAQQVPAPLRFEIHPWPDAAVLGAATVATLVPELFRSRLSHATCAPCSPAGLWGIDRGTVGPVRTVPARMSDVAFAGAAAGSVVLLLRSRPGEVAAARREDFAVLSEAMTVTAAVTDWMKVLVHRPRPGRYSSAALDYTSPGNGLSFPSGHTSQAFAAAAAYASILHRRGVAGRHRTEIAALFTTAAVTGVLRVVARKHFPTDVVAGAVLGTVIGWTVPALHRVAP